MSTWFRDHCGRRGREIERARDTGSLLRDCLLGATRIKSHKHDDLNRSWTRSTNIMEPQPWAPPLHVSMQTSSSMVRPHEPALWPIATNPVDAISIQYQSLLLGKWPKKLDVACQIESLNVWHSAFPSSSCQIIWGAELFLLWHWVENATFLLPLGSSTSSSLP